MGNHFCSRKYPHNMEKDDSEDDIWEYKPLEKKKKKHQAPLEPVTKQRCTVRKTPKRDASFSVKSRDKKVKTAENRDCSTAVEGHGSLDATLQSSPTSDNAAEGPSSGDFCPMCQMPFSILVVQTQRWHVAECIDIPRDTCKECPDGLQCISTIPNHYQKFNHTLLAHSRANSDTALLSLSQQAETSRKSSFTCLPEPTNKEGDVSLSQTSQESALSVSDSNRTPSKLTNGLLLLRSPGPEDLKKKKGWSSSTKSQLTVSASQESRTELSSTPVKLESRRQADECSVSKREPSPGSDDEVSYSPLSAFPAETENNRSECRKALFNNFDSLENEDENSVTLFNDSFSSDDELLTQFIDNLEHSAAQLGQPACLNTQLCAVTSSPSADQPAAATENREFTGLKEGDGKSTSAAIPCKSSFPSPQSVVLERLRQTLQGSDSLPLTNLSDSSIPVPSSQTSGVQTSQTMPPQKGQIKTGQTSCLKQTDIGVFFGLRPLKKEEKEVENGPNKVNATSGPSHGENSRQRRQRGDRKDKQKNSKADTAADASADNNTEVDAQGASGKGRTRGWRGRRQNRRNADGEIELPRCPFYKKIPGTKFAIDAFQYGEIQGIAAYFLTHFHSDHYGGLTKTFTCPIYCNRITGNLVKSKLKVAEQYVHILPMNTQVTVEGVKLILLDANHCPGAAMLLFFLPDGQTVLHTGDFRADPSMESYPELLSCRVQTLYLDTTYCSPEYTFPRQQEVINFAANAAFELVTLNPRTLVVCGSYSVGKEKVFLALAEVLGSKVCLSRDKYNTMCCLESDEIRQRITTDWKAAQVHVLPMMQVSFKKLQDYLARFSGRYDQLVAFKPTGWTFSQQVESVEDIQPQISGNVSIYGIPYSEHSSFLELKRFVQWLQPLKIIPTVNNGSWASRKAMEKCFSEWLLESKAKQ